VGRSVHGQPNFAQARQFKQCEDDHNGLLAVLRLNSEGAEPHGLEIRHLLSSIAAGDTGMFEQAVERMFIAHRGDPPCGWRRRHDGGDQ
jgi:hypothetical protein